MLKYFEKAITRDDYLGYICGLIATDGCLDKKLKRISFKQSHYDEAILYWMQDQVIQNPKERLKRNDFTRPNGKTYTYTKFDYHLPILYQYCLDMGITPNKSKTLDVNLEGKSEEFLWYFLRGVIDGDGQVYVNENKKQSRWHITISSASKVFLEELQRFFGGTLCKQGKTGIYHTLSYSGAAAGQLAKRLPVDSFCIGRKTTKLLQIREIELSLNYRASQLVGELWESKEKIKSYRDIYREAAPDFTYEAFIYRIHNMGFSVEEALNTSYREARRLDYE